jgi:hypothetical protein
MDRFLLPQEAAKAGRRRQEDFGVILTATLTLLGLIIGFSFSMAISRASAKI